METIATTEHPPIAQDSDGPSGLEQLQSELTGAFGVQFALYDGRSGQLLVPADQPPGDELYRGAMVRQVHQAGRPALIDEVEPLAVLAIPLATDRTLPNALVALSAFVTRPVCEYEALDAAAHRLGCSSEVAREWIQRQSVWPVEPLLRMANVVAEKLELAARHLHVQGEVEQLSRNLAHTYEEICLLYGVTQNLRISAAEEELADMTLDWLRECLPARCLAIQYLPRDSGEQGTYRTRTDSVLLTNGEPLLTNYEFSQLIESLPLGPGSGPFVANSNITRQQDWKFPQVRQLILVPLEEGEKVFGWLAALNHQAERGEFGTVEANLLNSVAAILGIHASNHDLYRQQAELLASVVRALTSAIDAKDPYTCGHSDRVARVSVRLARELGCSSTVLNTLYMAGLLHDVGKIGIDDQVLRKPGRLSAAEFEHIKLHPQLGHRILSDLRQLSDVLPIVLHHHEQWDGRGYPAGLEGEQIPLLARIAAVADAFDAMTSDRPYRKGLPVEEVERIFREGAGQQWDARVIDAYFRCRDEIIEISGRERANLGLDVEQWRD